MKLKENHVYRNGNGVAVLYDTDIVVDRETFNTTIDALGGTVRIGNQKEQYTKINSCNIFNNYKTITIVGKSYEKVTSLAKKLESLLNPTVNTFLRHCTDVYELCVIRDSGYIREIVWIDHEDLAVHSSYSDKLVYNAEWGELPIVNNRGDKTYIPCRYIDIKE